MRTAETGHRTECGGRGVMAVKGMVGMDFEQDYGPGTEPEEKMLTFKDCAAADIDAVFFNTDEFADEHTVNGKKLLAVLDENTLIDRSAHWEGGAKQSFDQGLYRADATLFVKCKELGGRPKVSSPMLVDGKKYLVDSVDEDAGVYCVALVRVRQ